MSVRSVTLTMAIFGAGTMFLLAWWLILTAMQKVQPLCLKEYI